MTPRTETLDNVVPKGKMFSTAYIMKKLAGGSLRLAIFEGKAAPMKAQIRKTTNKVIGSISQTKDHVQAALAKVRDVRSTSSYHPQYDQKANPFISDVNPRRAEGEDLIKTVEQFIKKAKNEIRTVEADKNLSKTEITNQLAYIDKERKDLISKIEKYGQNVGFLDENLRSLHNQLYTLLPQQDRITLKPPQDMAAPKAPVETAPARPDKPVPDTARPD